MKIRFDQTFLMMVQMKIRLNQTFQKSVQTKTRLMGIKTKGQGPLQNLKSYNIFYSIIHKITVPTYFDRGMSWVNGGSSYRVHVEVSSAGSSFFAEGDGTQHPAAGHNQIRN